MLIVYEARMAAWRYNLLILTAIYPCYVYSDKDIATEIHIDEQNKLPLSLHIRSPHSGSGCSFYLPANQNLNLCCQDLNSAYPHNIRHPQSHTYNQWLDILRDRNTCYLLKYLMMIHRLSLPRYTAKNKEC